MSNYRSVFDVTSTEFWIRVRIMMEANKAFSSLFMFGDMIMKNINEIDIVFCQNFAFSNYEYIT